jgi:low temperature requirement protein LtrA
VSRLVLQQDWKYGPNGEKLNTSDQAARPPSPLELFFDLTMAASFNKLGYVLASGYHPFDSFGFYVVMILALYAQWMQLSAVLNRFGASGAPIHL